MLLTAGPAPGPDPFVAPGAFFLISSTKDFNDAWYVPTIFGTAGSLVTSPPSMMSMQKWELS